MWTLLYAVCMFFILFDFPGNSSLIHSKRLLQCCQGNPGYVCYWLGCIQAAYIDTDTHTRTLKHNNALHKHCVCSGGVANWLNSQGGTIRSGGITCSIRCWQQELTVNIHVLDYIFLNIVSICIKTTNSSSTAGERSVVSSHVDSNARCFEPSRVKSLVRTYGRTAR